MAANTGIQDGGIAKLMIKAVPTAGVGYTVGHIINCSVSYSHDPREITSKTSSLGAKEYAAGLTGWTMSGEAFFAEDLTNNTVGAGGTVTTGSGNNYSTYFGYLKNRTVIYLHYGSFGTNAGDNVYTGSGYITALNRTSGNQGENETFTVELQGTGALSETTIST